MYKKIVSALLALSLSFSICACGQIQETEGGDIEGKAITTDYEYIEETLNLANNEDQEWTYDASADAWVLSAVSAVAYPELPDQQGVSVCVPGAYVTGIDTDGDGTADVTSDEVDGSVNGSLVIDYEAEVTSTNGQVYTAATAPVIINTGAAGYGSQSNSAASTEYAAEGYINVSCGNRGKQDTVTDENGNTYYTGDAPSCLVDQKAATRFVKYNILLGNLPGSVDYFVSTGGSGGGAHAAMLAATGNNSDYYNYLIEVGAVGVYQCEDGSYTTTVTIDGTDYELSDSMWGCVAYSAITSLYEADMALAFEYYLNADYSFSTAFQAQLAEYLSESYMEYINEQDLSVLESDVGFDLNGDGDLEDIIALTIEYDLEAYPETNGYYGTYLDLYLAEFIENLQWYVDNLDYAEGWTWFDEDGNALTDDEVAAMTSADKAQAFIEGRYTASSSTGDMGGGPGGGLPTGELPDGMTGPDGETRGGELPQDSALEDAVTDSESEMEDLTGDTDTASESADNMTLPDAEQPDGDLPDGDLSNEVTEVGEGVSEEIVGTPDSGTTQSNTGSMDSANYETYEEMVAAYQEDIEEIYAGDEYGNNIVSLYNPLNYIGADGTENPTWTRIMMGAAEGDMSMFSSLNLQIAWLNAGVDAEIEWQWDGGHVPSEILGESLSLYVDQMYGEYVDGAVAVTKQEAETQTTNGTATEAAGTDLSSWVSLDSDGEVSFTLADIAVYRTAGASKAMPGFDVIDYGQEDYVFGDAAQDARHWDIYLLEILEDYADVLEPLFNAGTDE